MATNTAIAQKRVSAAKARRSGKADAEPELTRLERLLADAFDFLSSLKLAVVLLSLLVVILTVGTIWEARYGMRAAHADLYKAWVFVHWLSVGPVRLPIVLPGLLLLLPLLAVNIFCATLSRFPWQRKHTGFVITHGGLLVLLAGSFLTLVAGIDGQLALREGESGNEVILLDRELLRLQLVSVAGEAHGSPSQEISIPLQLGGRNWPEGHRIELDTGRSDLRVAITNFYPRSEASIVYVDSPEGQPYLRLRMHGHIHPPGTPPHEEGEETGGMNVDQPVDLYVASGLVYESRSMLAPAFLVVRRLRYEAEVRDFLNPPSVDHRRGLLRVYSAGGVLDLPVEEYLEKRVAVPGTPYELEITKYDSHVGGGQDGERGLARPVVRVNLYQSRDDKVGRQHVVFAGWSHYPTDLLLWQDALQWVLQQGQVGELGQAFARYRLWPPLEPVKLVLYHPSVDPFAIPAGALARLDIALGPDNNVYYRLKTNSGQHRSGAWTVGTDISAWMGLELKLEQVRWHVIPERQVRPVPKWENENAPPAVRVEVRVGQGADAQRERFWLQRFETRTVSAWNDPHTALRVSYDTESLHLPFQIKLIDFAIGYDPGTGRPASYTSVVQVVDPERGVDEQHVISMNNPLKYRGLKFYQSSYFQDSDGTMVSVFAVGRDPGYPLKAIGSLMIVVGICVMFYMKAYFFAPRSQWREQFGRARTAREALKRRKQGASA